MIKRMEEMEKKMKDQNDETKTIQQALADLKKQVCNATCRIPCNDGKTNIHFSGRLYTNRVQPSSKFWTIKFTDAQSISADVQKIRTSLQLAERVSVIDKKIEDITQRMATEEATSESLKKEVTTFYLSVQRIALRLKYALWIWITQVVQSRNISVTVALVSGKIEAVERRIGADETETRLLKDQVSSLSGNSNLPIGSRSLLSYRRK